MVVVSELSFLDCNYNTTTETTNTLEGNCVVRRYTHTGACCMCVHNECVCVCLCVFVSFNVDALSVLIQLMCM